MKFNHVKMEEQEQEEFIDDSFSFAENIRKAFEMDKDNDDHKSIKGYHSISQFTGDACLRKIYYRVKNPDFIEPYNFDRDFVFKFGHAIHKLIQDKMSKFNLLHGVEEFFQDDINEICGSTDGYFIDHDKKEIRMMDIKTTNLGLFAYVTNADKPKKDHRHQLNVYAYYLLKKYPDYEMKSMHIIYINKNQSNHTNDFSRLRASLKTLENEHEIELINNHLSYIEDNMKDSCMKIKETIFSYDESIALAEIEKVQVLKEKIKNDKLPNKISKFNYCMNCSYVNLCRGEKWVQEQIDKKN